METFTHTTADGRELRFAHLTIYDVFGDPAKPDVNGLVPVYRKRLKRELLDNLRAIEADKGEMLGQLGAFDKEPVGLDTFLDLVNTPTGVDEVVGYAYRNANDGKVPEPALSPAELATVFWALAAPLGIQKREGATEDAPQAGGPSATYGDGTGGDPANPPLPPTYSATPTALTEPGVVHGETGSATVV